MIVPTVSLLAAGVEAALGDNGFTTTGVSAGCYYSNISYTQSSDETVEGCSWAPIGPADFPGSTDANFHQKCYEHVRDNTSCPGYFVTVPKPGVDTNTYCHALAARASALAGAQPGDDLNLYIDAVNEGFYATVACQEAAANNSSTGWQTHAVGSSLLLLTLAIFAV